MDKMGDDIPDTMGDDSYRRATDRNVPDDNLTAVGNVKSYRKTPYTSRIAGLDYGDKEMQYLADGPRDEHRQPLHELLGRLVTDIGTGLTNPQVRANIELYGPNSIAQAIQTPEWVRFTKCLFGGSSLFLWAAFLLCLSNYSIMAGQVSHISCIYSYDGSVYSDAINFAY
jgi:sodium/potassium-transporting ATPase subunit alpha